MKYQISKLPPLLKKYKCNIFFFKKSIIIPDYLYLKSVLVLDLCGWIIKIHKMEHF